MNTETVDITPSPLITQLKASISELEERLEKLGRCENPKVIVEEDGREYELQMSSENFAFIDGTFEINRVEYRINARAKLDELTGRWELAQLNGWRVDNYKEMTSAAKSAITANLHEMVSSTISQALSAGGYEAAVKANLRSELVSDLGHLRDLLDDVKRCDERAARYQGRAAAHLAELDEATQVSPLAELL